MEFGRAQTNAQAELEGVLMKKAVSTKKTNKTAADVVTQKKKTKSGPVELDLADLKKVAGGLPKGGWDKLR
jgi:hypothetical protein